ncbi:hypothetical protein F2Q69_00022307 [Brassica cretica]|uniref:Transposase MuDR plant domain-containing protein n=1 Tax=Brassica cretica TaxID=69181 RepID=A0A8S9Q818_BRACR|nr:hypothetical protein F2Q69_00022307 [Brassica cretica]
MEFDVTSQARVPPIARGLPLEEASYDCQILGKEALKLHMTLYAISNKFRYLVKKSEPRKILLECVEEASCGWRVYATKIGGCPKFEINTIENVHTCSVDDSWAF